MDDTPARASGLDELQRRLLVAGAGLDGAFGVPMLALPFTMGRLLRVEIPSEPVWFQLTGVTLLILAGVYAVSASSRRRHGVALAAGLGRAFGSTVMLAAWMRGLSPIFLVAACADATLGTLHVLVAARWWAGRGDAAHAGAP